jgi:pimeloyl-ACP methyl ester carboxylesterase
VDTAGNKLREQAVHDHYVQVGDVRTRYRTAGDGDPPLVLIHGLAASLESWQYNLDALARRHRTVALDVVWFGKSDKPAREITGDYFAEFIAGFMDAVGEPTAVLVGNSMGGMIAVKTALQHPSRVAGLVLVNSAGFGPELAWWLRLRTLVPTSKILRPSLRTYRYAVRQLVYDPRVVSDDLVQVFVEMANQPRALDTHRRVLKSGADWRGIKPRALKEIRDAAHAIRVPTLIIWGKQDRIVPVAHAEIARQSIPNAKLHIFDRCGHVPMIEKPDEFNALVTEFVSSHIIQPG